MYASFPLPLSLFADGCVKSDSYHRAFAHLQVMLSGTHTHSGPGGYAEYSIYLMTTLGFSKDNWHTIIDGIVNAISAAHDSVKPGRIMLNQGELLDSNLKCAFSLACASWGPEHLCTPALTLCMFICSSAVRPSRTSTTRLRRGPSTSTTLTRT
jgi:hypothetical protein